MRYVEEFKTFSKKHNLNITFNLNLLTSENFTVGVKDYEFFLDNLIQRKSTKYDIYFFDNIFTFKYGPSFENLEKYISKEEMNLFNYNIIKNTCMYNGNWVALVIYNYYY